MPPSTQSAHCGGRGNRAGGSRSGGQRKDRCRGQARKKIQQQARGGGFEECADLRRDLSVGVCVSSQSQTECKIAQRVGDIGVGPSCLDALCGRRAC